MEVVSVDNSINSNLSFKANLVTTLKGNKNIMKPIAEEFAKITKKTQGDMFIKRSVEASKYGLKDLSVGNAIVVTDKLNDLFAKDPEVIGQRGIKTIARKLADIFYSLKAEDTYKNEVDSCAEEIFNLRLKIQELTKLKTDSEKFGMPELAENYAKQINKYKSDIAGIENKVTSAQQALTKVWDRYPDNEVVRISKQVVSDDFKYDLKSSFNLLKIRLK